MKLAPMRFQCFGWECRGRFLRRAVLYIFVLSSVVLIMHGQLYRFLTDTKKTPLKVKTARDFLGEVNYSINHEDICDKNNYPLLVVIYSEPSNFYARQTLRMTWAAYAARKGAKVMFLLGRTESSFLQAEIEAEDAGYKDIIQAGFMDSYKNLTLKTVSMLKWVARYCSKVPFVLKIDDDVFLNVDALLDFIRRTGNQKKTIFGETHEGATPFRVFTKWRVSNAEYPDSAYPRYIKGPSYLLTSGAVLPLYQASLDFRFLFLEDVFTTGLVAENASVDRVELPGMHFHAQTVNFCTLQRIVTSHGHDPEEMGNIWSRIKRSDCSSKTRTVMLCLIIILFLAFFVLAFRYPPSFVSSPIA